MRVEVVTSFSKDGYGLYGKACVRSFLAHWPFPLTAYTDQRMAIDRIVTRHVSTLPQWAYTARRLRVRNTSAEKPDSYLWNAKRYAIKPFVWHDAATRIGRGIVAWLDADTVTTRSVPTQVLDDALADADVAYLGRGEMHPENGCVVFRVPEALPLLAWCREAYVRHDYRHWSDGWTDCHALRRGLAAVPVRARDLTSHAHDGSWKSYVDAFAVSPLGPYVLHLKGNRQKREGRLIPVTELKTFLKDQPDPDDD